MITDYGFEWGPIKVERMAQFKFRKSDKGEYRILGVTASNTRIEIHVSPTGKSVRIFRDEKELK